MKKRKPLQTSFVVTFAGTAGLLAFAPGCNGDIITNPPFEEVTQCPESAPSDGSECDATTVPESCKYDGGDCGATLIARCEGSEWNVQSEDVFSCNPPPPLSCPEIMPAEGDGCFGEGSCEYESGCGDVFVMSCPVDEFVFDSIPPPCNPPPLLECPETVPQAGGACFGEGSCEYTDECGQPIIVTCPEGVYDVKFNVSCNPPPPCGIWTDAESCIPWPSCRWLEPGCDGGGGASLAAAGCFPAEPCTSDAECEIDQSCAEVSVLPLCDGPDCPCGEVTTACVGTL